MISFANIVGFWALLGIPVILWIHFLQRQSQVLIISTLFLLDVLDRESVQGRKFDRIRNSIPLWLQLLAVLLLTWVLVQPRWTMENSVQKIAIILDSSASMRAFKKAAIDILQKEISGLGRGAKTMELTLLESTSNGAPIYNGISPLDLIASLEKWTPFSPTHDPGPALRVGRSLAGPKGTLLFVTDHVVETPGYDATVLSVGSPIPNVGFAGSDVDTSVTPASWQALVKNYSITPQNREWFLQSGNQRTETRNLELQPSETRTLQGRFPAGAVGITLRLAPDQFNQDDSAPIVIPKPKELAIAKKSDSKLDKVLTSIMESIENRVPPSSDSGVDLFITTYDPLSPTETEPVSIVLLSQDVPGRQFFNGPIVAANHPLIAALNWQGLIARSGPGMPIGPEDTILLWQGDRPLIFLRQSPAPRNQLVFNFDLASSNVEKLPSFIVLIHRFIESIRENKIAPLTANHELHEMLKVSCDRSENAPALDLIFNGVKTSLPLNWIKTLQAPGEPGFFEVRQGDKNLLFGGAQFADTREADFSQAQSSNTLAALSSTATNEHTRKDDAWPIWVLLTLLSVLLSWFFINRKDTPIANPTTT